MGRRHKLSRDQRRKQKLAKRRPLDRIESYHGNKFRSARYVETLLQAEIAILECYVISDRQLTDREVASSVRELIRELRGEKPVEPSGSHVPCETAGQPVSELIASRIKSVWAEFFADRPRHPNSELCGILRTMLASIDHWSRPVPDSREYLSYIEGFLGELGVRVTEVSPEDLEETGSLKHSIHNMLPDEQSDQDSDEAILARRADDWFESGDAMAKKEFMAEAQVLLAEGHADLVLETCQHLIRRAKNSTMQEELKGLMQDARNQQAPVPVLRHLFSRMF